MYKSSIYLPDGHTVTATGDVSDVEPLVRFDDLRANRSFVLTDHVASRCAASLDEVVSLIEAADEHARTGSWVAIMLTYEAGAAFDMAFPRRSPCTTAPLAWFGVRYEGKLCLVPELR